jgi:hypothetical protein
MVRLFPEKYYNAPLTMNHRVAMLVMCSPQFQTQDDFGYGDGISPILQWTSIYSLDNQDPGLLSLNDLDLEPTVRSVFARLRIVLRCDETSSFENNSPSLTTNDLHDLSCYVLHRLLLPPCDISERSTISECIRYATSIYVLLVHGPTYYSHAALLDKLIIQLQFYLIKIITTADYHNPFVLWCLTVGMASSMRSDEHQWYLAQAAAWLTQPGFRSWDIIESHLQSVLWVNTRCGLMFRQAWEQIIIHESLQRRLVLFGTNNKID